MLLLLFAIIAGGNRKLKRFPTYYDLKYMIMWSGWSVCTAHVPDHCTMYEVNYVNQDIMPSTITSGDTQGHGILNKHDTHSTGDVKVMLNVLIIIPRL